MLWQRQLRSKTVAFDETAYKLFKSKHPRAAATKKGETFWDGHPAQTLLKCDIKQQATDLKKGTIARNKLPAEMRDSRPEYKEFKLETFRNHYYREQRALIESVYWQKKRNREGHKKLEENVGKLSSDI
ncbi:hypothetical protein IV203_023449 [Nitzschia inconspicua]|uniref:Uncharacterized protein n=1 Tax=Nitzschia inconspicua TaxID=303405 RepID=A0A9K3KDH5_9STRA|nr:hypothetical protein IV203_023449 [Nitzschia inconspicua]